jgi:hypothetical protein
MKTSAHRHYVPPGAACAHRRQYHRGSRCLHCDRTADLGRVAASDVQRALRNERMTHAAADIASAIAAATRPNH